MTSRLITTKQAYNDKNLRTLHISQNLAKNAKGGLVRKLAKSDKNGVNYQTKQSLSNLTKKNAENSKYWKITENPAAYGGKTGQNWKSLKIVNQ